jgi:2-phospho-L-lactate guanylyltransferase
MPTVVVPFSGPAGKRRMAPLPGPERALLAQAMLADVLAACRGLGRTVVVAPESGRLAAERAGADVVVADPCDGQGAAVAAGLAHADRDGAVLVVNADLPCATAADVRALADALPQGGLALVEAADGTTNALALATPQLYRPLFGAGSAGRFRALAEARTEPIANLVDDVDTFDDLLRLEARLGAATRRALAALQLRVEAAA